MDDNQNFLLLLRRGQDRIEKLKADHFSRVRDMAVRATARPESLTLGEIQEVGWGFLLMARDRAGPTRLPH